MTRKLCKFTLLYGAGNGLQLPDRQKTEKAASFQSILLCISAPFWHTWHPYWVASLDLHFSPWPLLPCIPFRHTIMWPNGHGSPRMPRNLGKHWSLWRKALRSLCGSEQTRRTKYVQYHAFVLLHYSITGCLKSWNQDAEEDQSNRSAIRFTLLTPKYKSWVF